MKKTAIVVFVIFLLAALMLGCSRGSGKTASGPGDSASTTNVKPEDYKGEITMWSWSGDWWKLYISEFNKAYPNIKVKLVEYSYDNYYTKLNNSMQGGSGAPDVIEIEEGQIASLLDSGQLEDLSKEPYNADKSVFFPSVVDTFVNSKGELVGLPEAANAAGVWYNRKVAKQYLGTDDPEQIKQMIGSGEDSFDKFIHTMQTIVDKSAGKVKGVGSLADMLQMFQLQHGNKMFDGNKIVYEDTYKDSYQLLDRMAKADLTAKLVPFQPPWMETVNNDSVAFYPGAVWYEGYVIPKNKENEGKWGFVPSPGPGWTWGDQATAIWSKSKNKDLAWVWVKWFCTSKEGQILQAQVSAIPPGVKSAFDMPELQQVDPITTQNNMTEFAAIFKNAVPKVHTTNDAAVAAATKQVIQEMEEKKIDGSQALKKVVDETLKRARGISR